jgi:hypothetical protein
MKNKLFIITLMILSTCIIISSCGNKANDSSSKNSEKTKEVEIAGDYVATDQYNREVLITLRKANNYKSGKCIIEFDGDKKFCKWSGDPSYITIYETNEYGVEIAGSTFSVTEEGLNVIGEPAIKGCRNFVKQ